MSALVVTAEISAVGRDTSIPRAHGAVEARIRIDGAAVGLVRLRLDGQGLLSEWNTSDRGTWCDDAVRVELSKLETDEDRELLTRAIVHAVRMLATHNPAAAIQTALVGMLAKDVAELLDLPPGRWSEYRNGLRSPRSDMVDKWQKLLEAKGRPVVMTWKADRCVAEELIMAPGVPLFWLPDGRAVNPGDVVDFSTVPATIHGVKAEDFAAWLDEKGIVYQ